MLVGGDVNSLARAKRSHGVHAVVYGAVSALSLVPTVFAILFYLFLIAMVVMGVYGNFLGGPTLMPMSALWGIMLATIGALCPLGLTIAITVAFSKRTRASVLEYAETSRALVETRHMLEAQGGEVSLIAEDAEGGELSMLEGEKGALSEPLGD